MFSLGRVGIVSSTEKSAVNLSHFTCKPKIKERDAFRFSPKVKVQSGSAWFPGIVIRSFA